MVGAVGEGQIHHTEIIFRLQRESPENKEE